MRDTITVEKMLQSLGNLAKRLQALKEQKDSISESMATLKEQGLIYASEWWKDEKYLYLVYPTKVGEKRKRVYVGRDPVKIKEAKDAIERGREYNSLGNNLEAITDKFRGFERDLQQASRTLESGHSDFMAW